MPSVLIKAHIPPLLEAHQMFETLRRSRGGACDVPYTEIEHYVVQIRNIYGLTDKCARHLAHQLATLEVGQVV